MGTIKFIRPSDGHEWSTDFCEPNLNLLAHAQALEIGIGSRCGGHGICGGDRVQVRTESGGSGALSAPTAEERAHLSETELTQGFRLACQCYPERSDLHLELEAQVVL